MRQSKMKKTRILLLMIILCFCSASSVFARKELSESVQNMIRLYLEAIEEVQEDTGEIYFVPMEDLIDMAEREYPPVDLERKLIAHLYPWYNPNDPKYNPDYQKTSPNIEELIDGGYEAQMSVTDPGISEYFNDGYEAQEDVTDPAADSGYLLSETDPAYSAPDNMTGGFYEDRGDIPPEDLEILIDSLVVKDGTYVICGGKAAFCQAGRETYTWESETGFSDFLFEIDGEVYARMGGSIVQFDDDNMVVMANAVAECEWTGINFYCYYFAGGDELHYWSPTVDCFIASNVKYVYTTNQHTFFESLDGGIYVLDTSPYAIARVPMEYIAANPVPVVYLGEGSMYDYYSKLEPNGEENARKAAADFDNYYGLDLLVWGSDAESYAMNWDPSEESFAIAEETIPSDEPDMHIAETGSADAGEYCEDSLFSFKIPEGSFQPANMTGICMYPSEEYKMYLREQGAANGLEDIAEEDIERMMKSGYNYIGWIDDGRNGFTLIYDAEVSSAREGAEVLYNEALKSGFHDSADPESYSVTWMERKIGGYPAYVVRQVGDKEIMGSQENYVALLDAPTGEVVRFNYYLVDQATSDAVEEIFATFQFK